jgi:hypothetical protein
MVFVLGVYIMVGLISKDPILELLFAAVAVSTSGVAAFDSAHVNLRKYNTRIAYGPIGLFVASAIFWPYVIIWYSIVRVRIARGTLPLKHNFPEELRHKLLSGKSFDEALGELRASGASISECIKSVRAFHQCDRAEARRVVQSSSAWSDKLSLPGT